MGIRLTRIRRLLAEDRALTGAADKLETLADHLCGKKSVLITTSNRWSGHEEKPKSTLLAEEIASYTGSDVIDAAALKIAVCEGNVSSIEGNGCGVKESMLKDRKKNPTGFHRCWASINNKDDELWKITKPMLDADAVVFFASVRWGQTNSIHQKLIERLTWLENRHASLGEDNVLAGKESGIVVVGHNWRAQEVMDAQKKVLQFFGFDTPDVLSTSWQWTPEAEDETDQGYEEDPNDFARDFQLVGIDRLLKKRTS